MDTKFETKLSEESNNYYENETVDNLEFEQTQKNEIPWKRLSLGGAFGLLIGGGSIVAANTYKSGEEEALLAGAEVGGEVEVVGENNDSTDSTTETGNETATDNQPIPVTETHNSSTPANSTTNVNIHVTPSHQQNQHVDHINQHVDHINQHANHINQHVDHIDQHMDVYHEVNVIDMDDNLSFAQAFAQARAELGAGGAFEWRGGVFGTYHANEWNALSHEEQANFTATAMNTYANALHGNYNLAHNSVTHHFTEGDVIDIDTGMPFQDKPYHIESIEVQTVTEPGDTADLDIADNDIQVIEGDTADIDFDNNDIQIIDSFAEAREDVQDLIEVNEAVGDFLSDVSNIIDDFSAAESSFNEVASLINGNNDFSEPESTADFSYDMDNDVDITPDPLPDYVSNGDTADIV